MDLSIGNILLIGLNDGLLWFPLVLGIGLLYEYLKEIDVSIDGIVILSGIATAFAWQETASFILSISVGMATGLASATLVCALQIFWRIPGLMAGILFSLVAHALSVLFVGESIILHGTRLLTRFGEIALWQVILAVILGGATVVFFNTRFGIGIRKLGSGCHVNTVYSSSLLRWSAYACAGLLYGLGGALYAHSQGMAKSGGAFEFLLISLSAYLCTTRVFDFVIQLFGKLRQANVRSSQGMSPIVHAFFGIATSPAVKAFVGAFLFETVLFLTIAFTPNPILWKLIFALLLVIGLARWGDLPRLLPCSTGPVLQTHKFSLHDLHVCYDIGTERRDVFVNSSAVFGTGINLILGPNGTGKSTLLKTIYGEIQQRSGRLIWNEQELSHCASHQRPIYFMKQNPMDSLSPELSVSQNLFLANRVARTWEIKFSYRGIVSTLQEQLAIHGLNTIYGKADPFWDKPVRTLSGGEAHCVAAYCALMADAKILLADEPTTGLDLKNFDELTKLFRILAEDRIILLTSHDHRVDELARSRYTVGNGKIIHDV